MSCIPVTKASWKLSLNVQELFTILRGLQVSLYLSRICSNIELQFSDKEYNIYNI